jgi:hypothetical protein
MLGPLALGWFTILIGVAGLAYSRYRDLRLGRSFLALGGWAERCAAAMAIAAGGASHFSVFSLPQALWFLWMGLALGATAVVLGVMSSLRRAH